MIITLYSKGNGKRAKQEWKPTVAALGNVECFRLPVRSNGWLQHLRLCRLLDSIRSNVHSSVTNASSLLTHLIFEKHYEAIHVPH